MIFIDCHYHLRKECLITSGEEPKIVGAAVCPHVFQEFETAYPPTYFVPTKSGETFLLGIPVVVFPIPVCEVIFFTDEEVWKRFLQHTDQ